MVDFTMFINKLLEYNGSASILFNNEKAEVNSLHYFDSSGCYSSCCDHKFYDRSGISGEKLVISRQTTSDLAELTEIWSFIEHFCKLEHLGQFRNTIHLRLIYL
ncbi:unnamed protein product [Schistosoma guineensis]|nr:unnamed protein product [Schistosoma guineensis]